MKKNAYKIFIISMLFLFCLGCHLKRQSSGNFFAGDFVHSKKDKDIMESKEILITSLFTATSHIPDEIKTDMEFFEHGKSSLSKEARAKIARFARTVLTYEDYYITVEGHEDFSETPEDGDYNRLSEKRAENVKKALIRNGIDKDKIEAMGIGMSKPASKEKNEEAVKQNRRVIIEAELW
jgi:outer membrane protein OmpA-like peptidoglycan-associated protein